MQFLYSVVSEYTSFLPCLLTLGVVTTTSIEIKSVLIHSILIISKIEHFPFIFIVFSFCVLMCFSYFVIEIYILLSLRKLFKKKLNNMHKLTFSERWCPCLFPVATIKPWLKADSKRSLLNLQSFK